jgi:prepilin-type N-terminal cleavage/methylation domain-containing protein
MARSGTLLAPQARSGGFSLVELLVVVAIIGTLVALLLPAVQQARESSHRTACLNNLHQMGVALAAYHDLHHTFPPGGVEFRLKPKGPERQLAWCVFLLPQLEQQTVYDRLDLSAAFDSPKNADGAASVLEVFICPSVPHESYLASGRGCSDYGGIYGERITKPNSPPRGTMLYDRAIAAHEITDGLSTTLMISEDSAWPDGQWINGRNVFDQAYAINAVVTPLENEIRSLHPLGANALLADGSARFISQSIELGVLSAICTRGSGEPHASTDW